MNARKATVDLTWNGAAAGSYISGMTTSFSYIDPASGEADSIDISVMDRDRQWISAWMPQTGDILTASIVLQDWEREGDFRSLFCGFFVLDDFSFSGWPITGNISAVSVPADKSFRETQRSKTWENVTIKEIGTEIAGRAGVGLVWDVPGDFIISYLEQSAQTDCEFLMSLCTEYGYSMKVYSHKIVIFDREAYKMKPSVAALLPSDIESWSWKTSLAGTYTGGEYTYTDPFTEEDIVVRIGYGDRVLKLSGKADNAGDALRKIIAALNNANHGATSMSVTIRGNASLYAGQCVDIVGIERMSDKYYIDSITHTVGGGYTMQLELSKAG